MKKGPCVLVRVTSSLPKPAPPSFCCHIIMCLLLTLGRTTVLQLQWSNEYSTIKYFLFIWVHKRALARKELNQAVIGLAFHNGLSKR